MATEAYLGLDIGGTGAKAGVFDSAGGQMGLGHCAFTPRVAELGHVEIEIEEIYRAARAAVAQAMRAADTPVKSMAIVSQGQTFVSLDDQDCPLHPAIIWYDSRAGRQAEVLREKVRLATGRVPAMSSILTAPKIEWLRENHPEIMRKARRFLLLPDYFAYRLTGTAAIDPHTAGSTGLLSVDHHQYDPAILKAVGIDTTQVAKIIVPGGHIGRMRKPMAAEWGLSSETLLVSGTNDQYAGAIGAGNCRPGIFTETSGTCLAVVTLTDRLPSPMPPGLFGGIYPIKPYYFVLAFAKTAGVLLDWFRKEFAGGINFDVLNAEAASVPIGCRGVSMVPHFDGMISPLSSAAMRGQFSHLTLQHTRADLYRSILEALAFSLRENLELMAHNNFAMETVRCIGGGARNEFWLQMKADVIGHPVEKPAVTESAVLGAAMLAAWGAGAFGSLEETSAAWYRIGRVFMPNMADHERYAEPYGRYRELINQALAAPSKSG